MNYIFNNKIYQSENYYIFVRKKKYKYNNQLIFGGNLIDISNDTLKIKNYTDSTFCEKDGYWVLPIAWIKKIISLEKFLKVNK
jgi:hypothetical protein